MLQYGDRPLRVDVAKAADALDLILPLPGPLALSLDTHGAAVLGGMGEMVAETQSRGSRRFPEICINLRTGSRSSRIFLPPAVQIAAASAVVAFTVAVCYFR